ncbi:M3 family oligoendopeptidase [Halobacillus shinanisalinarum]|uniref:M3 family oligoendopeptidase n=1 Tax=Halobacillus shinanisalinarum TaxID=2932258 RepID=A0ABY4GWY1_9BACI|nr:M3 family oligoendopeptidase [Halobacillus shinanisalinarum]UOQ92681.1 M3 family oligoendopeptidase [Halobacillus shinanisalinarum]
MKQLIGQNWKLDSLYPNHSGKLEEQLSTLSQQIDQLHLNLKKTETAQDFLPLFPMIETVINGCLEVDDFLICVSSDDVNNAKAGKLLNESTAVRTRFDAFLLELDHLLSSLSEQEWKELLQYEQIQPGQFFLEERTRLYKDKLPLNMEKLITTLSTNGFAGWEDHHNHTLGRLKVPVGEDETLSAGQALNKVMFANDRMVRLQTNQALEEVCEQNKDAFATILNRIMGFRLDVYQQRGWKDPLKELLDQNRIKQQTLKTMMTKIKQNKEMVNTFLKRKAELNQLYKLAWHDFFAPSFTPKNQLTYTEAVDLILYHFYNFSDKLGDFAKQAFENGWVEAEDRTNKAPGAFCASLPLAKESRVFLTFSGSYQDVVTLAHELGHAYHNYILHEESAFSQQTCTSVAETASTFTENLVLDAAINKAEKEEKLSLLEMKITNGLKYLTMIPAMFEFEQKLYQKRQTGLVSADEIGNLMVEVERDLYGETVDEFDRYRWMTVSHFYDTEQAFFNIPYTIGYLFSNGVYAMSKSQGAAFPQQYDELLRNSGSMTTEQLAKYFLDQDLEEGDFWEASIQPIRDAIEEYLFLTKDRIQ